MREWYIFRRTPARIPACRHRQYNSVESDPVRAIAQKAHDAGETVSERVQWIFRYCSEIPPAPRDDPALILSQVETNATPLGRARTMVALCRSIDIPARLVTGFEIKQTAQSRTARVGRSLHGISRGCRSIRPTASPATCR